MPGAQRLALRLRGLWPAATVLARPVVGYGSRSIAFTPISEVSETWLYRRATALSRIGDGVFFKTSGFSRPTQPRFARVPAPSPLPRRRAAGRDVPNASLLHSGHCAGWSGRGSS